MKRYFTKGEISLWFGSCAVIVISFWMFHSRDYLTLTASLVGVTSLIFNAKGNPLGPLLMVAFSLLYGVISYSCAYYGEMITYLGMTMPMAVIALISWLKHPYQGKKTQVKINRLQGKEWWYLAVLTAVVTAVFYFVLKALHTDALILSTVSVTTSFAAVYLTFCRSAWYAIAYAANDLVLIVLWILASGADSSYLSVVICFAIFFVNDIYGFLNWQKMARAQTAG
ncbi:MAG: nicotinamide mononucleotide transporter [Oscillospiraceae bacterium]|nr:nicotinamide mononucleotide transporter [Oscillospiraceae bacterium]